MKSTMILIAAAAFAVSAAGADSPALQPAPQPAPPHKSVCIQTSDIDSMSYPDNKTIIFRMNGGPVKVWRNDLAHECPGLAFERGIAWSIWGNSVCSNMQIFYVLRRGTPCQLGNFTAVETRPPAH